MNQRSGSIWNPKVQPGEALRWFTPLVGETTIFYARFF